MAHRQDTLSCRAYVMGYRRPYERLYITCLCRQICLRVESNIGVALFIKLHKKLIEV